MLITPTGCTAETLRPERTSCSAISTGPPTARSRRHRNGRCTPRSMPASPTAKAVVHTHSDHCVALPACTSRSRPSTTWSKVSAERMCPACPTPLWHAQTGRGGRQGTGDSDGAVSWPITACLPRGRTLHEAFEATIRLESIARQYRLALSIGEPEDPHRRADGRRRQAIRGLRAHSRGQGWKRWMVPYGPYWPDRALPGLRGFRAEEQRSAVAELYVLADHAVRAVPSLKSLHMTSDPRVWNSW